jgi:hypothetical protein
MREKSCLAKKRTIQRPISSIHSVWDARRERGFLVVNDVPMFFIF